MIGGFPKLESIKLWGWLQDNRYCYVMKELAQWSRLTNQGAILKRVSAGFESENAGSNSQRVYEHVRKKKKKMPMSFLITLQHTNDDNRRILMIQCEAELWEQVFMVFSWRIWRHNQA